MDRSGEVVELTVIVQAPNQPRTRRRVGLLPHGEKPTSAHFKKWGVVEAKVIDHRRAFLDRHLVYLIVEEP